MTCECCNTERQYPGFKRFTPACIYCGARYIQRVRALKTMANQERTSWAQQVLADWVAYGHSEIDIRRMVNDKKTTPIEPEQMPGKKQK